MVGLVGDHLRIGRQSIAWKSCGPSWCCLTLLPYLGFAEAQRWANQVAA